jgi:hypothetical protein
MDENSFLAASCFLVPSPAKDVSYKTSTARGMYLSLWEGAWLGSRETSVTTVRFSSRPPYLILAGLEIAFVALLFFERPLHDFSDCNTLRRQSAVT